MLYLSLLLGNEIAALSAKWDADALQLNLQVKEAQNQFDKEIGCFLLCSAGGAAVPIVASAGGLAIGGGQIVQTVTTGALGGSLNIGLNELKAEWLGDDTTAADRTGSFVAGALGAPGVLRFGNLSPVTADAVRGFLAEGGGSLAKQVYNYVANGEVIQIDDLVWSASNGAVASAAVGKLSSSVGSLNLGFIPLDKTGALKVPGLTSGQNNWASVYQGQVTRLSNGHISQIAPLVQIKGGAALAVGDIPNATLGTALQSTLDAAREKMSQPTAPIVNTSPCQKDSKSC